jgi:hypothetical protein
MLPEKFDPNKPTVGKNKPEPHVVGPEGAIKVFNAQGEFGDKVAIAGFSVSNFGLFASSEQSVGLFAKGKDLAAEFEGNVAVTGNCEIIGALHSTGNSVCDGDLHTKGNQTLDGDIHTKGNHTVDGDIQLSGADYAEDFDIVNAEEVEPGTVMVLDDSGGVRVSDRAYDRRVAGVVSGAADYKPAVILDRKVSRTNRRPLALMGKVYCKVDASSAPIVIGDLLTTSSTPGHAMKAVSEPALAFGTIIGKALRPILSGKGLIPILVALQ